MIESIFIHLGKALGLPPELAIFWDISKAEVVSPESISSKLKKRTNDIIIKIPPRCIPLFDGIPLAGELYVIIEFQSQPDWKMPKRMMRYFKNVFRRLWKQVGHKGIVPQLLCIVLYHGKKLWPGPEVPLVSLYDNNRPGKQIAGTFPEHRVNLRTLDVTGMPEDAWAPALCRIEQAEDFETVVSVLKAIFTKHSAPEDDALCEAMYNRVAVIKWFPIDREGNISVPYEEARRNILGDIPMPEIVTHIDQLMYDSRQEGQRELLGRQAAMKFNGRTAKRLEALLETINDDDVLAKIGEAVIDCGSGKEFINVCKGLSNPH